MSGKLKTRPFSFGKKFEDVFLKKQLQNPKIAILELIANSWDAEATKVNILWPIIEGLRKDEKFPITDNGTGMDYDEFNECWGNMGMTKEKKMKKGVY